MVGCLVSDLSHAQVPGEWVKPRQLFPSAVLNIYSPDSDQWIITAITKSGVSFGKKGRKKNETYGASANIFSLPSTVRNDEFVEFVKKRIVAINPPPRFREISSNYQYSESRDYPCVHARMNFYDTVSVTPSGIENLELQIFSVYCRHPTQPELGFHAAYSHRGNKHDDQLESAAKSFIEGVVVPKK